MHLAVHVKGNLKLFVLQPRRENGTFKGPVRIFNRDIKITSSHVTVNGKVVKYRPG